MTKAIVYIWPLMSKPAMQAEEDKLVEAGYTDKKGIPITGRCLDASQKTELMVWKVT